jgi:DNA-binding CsgD family transcriptional regulator
MARHPVHEILEAASQLEDQDRFSERVLEILGSTVPSDTAVYACLGHQHALPATVKTDERHVQGYLAHQRRYLPGLMKGALAAARSGGAILDTAAYTSEERDRLPFFAEVIRPQAVTSQIMMSCLFRNRSVAAIHLCRTGRGTPFDEGDVSLLQGVVTAIGTAQAAFFAHAKLRAIDASSPPPTDALSPREREVAGLLRHGLTNREIADALRTSVFTVRNQVSSIFAKLGVAGRAELVSLLVRAQDLP